VQIQNERKYLISGSAVAACHRIVKAQKPCNTMVSNGLYALEAGAYRGMHDADEYNVGGFFPQDV
jgi:hypothetical protein